MSEPRHPTGVRPGPCLDPEVLAALVDGGLESEERREAREHLSLCEDCAEAFSEVLQITEEMSLGLDAAEVEPISAREETEARSWEPVVVEGADSKEPGPPARPLGRSRRGWGWQSAAALAAGLAAAVAVFFFVRPERDLEFLSSGPYINRWAERGSLVVQALASPGSLFPRFRSGVIAGVLDGVEAAKIGALFTHLEYLVGKRQPELALETLEELSERLPVTSRLSVALDSMESTLEHGELPGAEEMEAARELLDLTLLESPSLELGRWAELARIAVIYEEDLEVLGDRPMRRALSRLVRESQAELSFGDFPPSAAEPLARLEELLEGGVTEEELPEVQEQVEELLRL